MHSEIPRLMLTHVDAGSQGRKEGRKGKEGKEGRKALKKMIEGVYACVVEEEEEAMLSLVWTHLIRHSLRIRYCRR